MGFDIVVYSNNEHSVTVQSNGLLEDSYENFETFLDELIIRNPLWFTYASVRIIPEYREQVKNKLSESYKNIFNWINTSIIHTHSNWCFEDAGLGDFAKNEIQNIYKTETPLFHLSKSSSGEKSTNEKWELDQMWNGYCPESWLKGKRVRMRLNKNDFFESEETGLQIAVLSGIQAVILNFRGKGIFRSTETFADQIENGELLSPQNTDQYPFNKPTEVFEESEDIEKYINTIS